MISEIVITKAAYNKLWDNRRNMINGREYLVLSGGMILVDSDLRQYIQSGDRGDTVPYQIAHSSLLPTV